MRVGEVVRSVFTGGGTCVFAVAVTCVPLAVSAALKYEPSNYAARDALLLQLDGLRNVGLLKAHDNQAAQWHDLAGGNRVTFGHASGSGVTSRWADDGYVFGGGEIGRLAETVNPGSAFTVQVVCDTEKSAQTAAYPHYLGISGDKCNLYTYKSTDNNKLVFRVRAVGNVSDSSIQSWTGRQNYLTALYHNGKSVVFNTETGSVTAGANTASVGAQPFTLAGIYTGTGSDSERYLNGTIKAVRVYNKVLSASELAQNRALDEIRFFAGIPVTNVVVATSVAGLEGNEGTGVYAYDEKGYTFTAPHKATKDGAVYVCAGYALETWTGAAWSSPVRFASSSYTATDTSAKVRLTWQWQRAGQAVSADLDPLFDDYVTDGLVLHLDGIRNAGADVPHDYSAAQWVDLAGGKTAVFSHDEPDASEWRDDGYYFDARSYARFTEKLAGLGRQVTVQVVCEADTNILYASKIAQNTRINWPMLVGCNDNDTLNVYYDLNAATPHHQLTFKCATTDNNTYLAKLTWGERYATAIRDGTDKYVLQGTRREEAIDPAHKTGTKNDAIPESVVYVGSAGSRISLRNARWFKGTIKAVRIYNRVLTDSELAQNRLVDEVRFFGAPMPVTNVVVASAVRGISGDTSEGVYALSAGGHTFTAPETVTAGEDVFTCAGYTLETWDQVSGTWGEPVLHGGERTVRLTDPAAKVRLVWQWTHAAGPGFDLAFNDYVTDGLIVHLDGIRNTGAEAVHDGRAALWADLANRGDYARLILSGTGCGWTRDGFRFDGLSVASYAVMNSARTLGNMFTAQAVVDFDCDASHRINTAWPAILGTTDVSGDPFSMYYNQNNNSSPGVNFKVANTQVRNNGVQAWDGQYMTGLADGVKASAFQTATPDVTADFNGTVGTRTFTFCGGNGSDKGYADRRYNGVGKAVRFYDRALTDAELIQNRTVDEARFFGRAPAAAAGDLLVASAVAGLAGNLPCGVYRPAEDYVFTAPETAVLDGVSYELTGYTLETWNGSTWTDAVIREGQYAVRPDVASASKRLTWNWRIKSRLTKIRSDYDVGDYVQNGLYLFYDGIRNAGAAAAHDPNATTWANLAAGGAAFDAVFDAATGDASGGWAEDGYRFVYGGRFATLGAEPVFDWKVTVQIVCERGEKLSTYPTLFGSTNDYCNLYEIRDNGVQIRFKPFNLSAVKENTWSGQYVNAIWHGGRYVVFQGEKPDPAAWTGTWRSKWDSFKNQPFYIGGVYKDGSATYVNDRRFNGKIQAVRVYNRSLSDEELAHNRLVDEIRFKGKSPESDVTVATKYGDGTDETLREETGLYRVDGTYTFSATEVKGAKGTLEPVAGYYLAKWENGDWSGGTWHDGNSFVYRAEMGVVRLTWSPARGGLSVLIR